MTPRCKAGENDAKKKAEWWFLTTCRWRVIKRSHSCLETRRLCWGVKFPCRQMTESGADVFQTFMFSSKTSKSARDLLLLFSYLVAHRGGCAPTNSVSRGAACAACLSSWSGGPSGLLLLREFNSALLDWKQTCFSLRFVGRSLTLKSKL